MQGIKKKINWIQTSFKMNPREVRGISSASEPKTGLEALAKAISRCGEKRWRAHGYIGAGSA
jgi:hypothetical protein